MDIAQQIAFPPFSLDPVNECLWRDGEPLSLTPKAYAVLRVLVAHAGQLVTKEAFLQTVWPDTYVTDTVLKVCINEIRTVLGDDAKSPRFIETVHRRGYRFVATVGGSQQAEANQKAKGKNQKAKIEDFSRAPNTQHPAPPLVGRDAELTQLHKLLEKSLHGERQLVFVTGEAGIGKTALIDAFRRRIETGDWRLALPPQTSNLQPPVSSLLFAGGQCVEHYGAGEAYLPVFDALGRLCRGAVGGRVIALLRQHAPLWLSQMPAVLSSEERAAVQREVIGATPERMLREMVDVLEVLTTEHPFVLVLEDLQWSDSATLSLLTALARRREAVRLLVIASYRPIDVILSDHPVKQMKQELHAHRFCVELAPELLTEDEVLAYLAAQLPEMSAPSSPLPLLARALHHRTEGNPLFLVNVVTDLISRGIVVEQPQGQWHLTVPVDEIELSVPASLRPLIEQHVLRATPDEQRLLEMLSVAGGDLSVALLANGLEEAPRVVEEWCERLANRERLVRAYGSEPQPDGTVTERYGLSHAFYQHVLYEGLSEARRARLHQRLGEVKEACYAAHANDHAAELALHFERGRNVARALHYLAQAARNATQHYAYREAVEYFTKALALLQRLPDTPERAQHEFTLRINLSLSLLTVHGEGSPDVTQALRRAQELSQRGGNPLQLWYALVGQWSLSMFRGDVAVGSEIATHILHLVEQGHENGSSLGGHLTVGFSHLYAGRFVAAQEHLDRVLALYDTETHRASLHALVSLDMVDPRVVCGAYTAQLLWFRGYADQARSQMEAACTLAWELAQPYLVATALNLRTMLATAVEPVEVVARYAAEHIAYATEQGFPHWATLGGVLQG
ncbi:MAG: AAA family ATPase, partial [Deltaproteobacteria bacterium]|nr:AAA family ATPase [Deltaproteobacteria bacterium]